MAEPLLAPAAAAHSLEHNDELLITGEAVALDVRPASFILRAAGGIIDVLVSLWLLVLLILLLPLWEGHGDADPDLATALMLSSLVFCIVVVPTGLETLMHGRSLGKLVIGARVVRDDGGAASFRHAFIRALTGVLEIYLTFGGLAIIVALLNAKSKRLGDLLAGTFSQHERVPRLVSNALPVPPPLLGWAQIADVAKLPDRLSRRIAQFLAQAPRMTPDARARHAWQLMSEAAPYVAPLTAAPPEVMLTGIAALRRDREFQALQLERARLERLAPVLAGLPHGFPER
ncbi:RDD family protein [Subtercola lobariae]|uniref:RDD family protein n=1 Tax=Subtercola lobariae TaxID=1588641 RepID=A0A917ETN6_9MICO|nr:RDD family protein [Subtercola lobariae]GGF14347.1 RDD family protein [Subtercola lobariae]